MDLTQYPLPADVQAVLQSAQMWPVDAGQQTQALVEVGVAVAAAIGEWENRTGWTPFLAGAGTATRPFNVRDAKSYLPLQGGLVDTDTHPPVVQVQNNTLTTLTASTNYWFHPTDAPSNGRPYTGIEFVVFGPWVNRMVPNQVTVQGRWGYCVVLPADAWAAIREKAAAVAFAKNAASWMVFITSETMPGGYSQSSSRPVSPKDRLAGWMASFESTLARYVRHV